MAGPPARADLRTGTMVQPDSMRGVASPGAPETGAAPASLVSGPTLSDFDGLYVRRPRRWLALILVAFAVVAIQYALVTPRWQAPDEPAHYNYIAHIATTGSLPVLAPGDYNHTVLRFLVDNQFPPAYSTARLRYESYQPPLYYISAVPVFWAGGGSVYALRLYSVALALAALSLLYLCLELVFPGKPLITLGATAFAALLPMHVAVAGSVTNDVLAELLLLGAALALLRWMRDAYAAGGPAARPTLRDITALLLLGVLIGLGLLTKIYAFAFLPIALAAVVWTHWWHRRTWRSVAAGLSYTLWVLLPALALAAPMWLRNVQVYGWADPMGLNMHDLVVQGQTTTAEWIAEYGVLAYFEQAFNMTYRTFWGAFGWAGVMMSNRVYVATLIFTGVIFLGLLWSVVRLISGRPDADMNIFQVTVLALLGLLALAVLAAFVWYNLKFVQHQGRYFFWGMLAISTSVALAWREVMHPFQGAITGLMAAVLAFALIVSGLISGDPRGWTILIVTSIALLLLAQPFLLTGEIPGRLLPLPAALQRLAQRGTTERVFFVLRAAAWSLPFVLAFILNLLVPWIYIAPQLAR